MKLIVFHYHLLPGGVTDVIVHSIQAVVGHRTDISLVRLVCGREENTWTVLQQLNDLSVDVELDIVEDLDYTHRSERTEDALDRAARLAGVLMERYGDDDALWWVHNYHVGKNPAFTQALCSIAARDAAPRMLLHVHDFPECARYENLDYLTRVAGESPYPAGSTVQYAVINARDRSLMENAGIPGDRLHMLVNPLPDATGDGDERPDRGTLVSAFARFSEDDGQSFNPDTPLLLYPIRTIRRKNVLEMAALARLAGDANLIVTLPGVSDAERPYSELVARAFSDGAAHGIWGIGRREREYGISYEAMAHGADAIVSSSVQEGFGLLFINALRWKVPLFARYLPVLDGVNEIFDGYPAEFYSTFRVPFSTPGITSLKALLRMRYTERLDELGQFLPARARTRLDGQLETMMASDMVDYAFLPPDMQYALLRGLDDAGFAGEIRSMNAVSVDALARIPVRTPPDHSQEVERMFGFRSFAESFDQVLRSFDTASPARSASSDRYDAVQPALIVAFADLEYLRLLFAPMGHRHG